MKILNNRNTLSLQMIYAGYHCAGKEWCYENIISPFSRLYLINEGKAAVYMNKKKYELSPGELFIIPKFTFHTYECDDFMNHYYICFFDQLIGGRSLFENTTIRYQLPAKEIDRMLMLRFLELNPDCAVRNPEPFQLRSCYRDRKQRHSSTALLTFLRGNEVSGTRIT